MFSTRSLPIVVLTAILFALSCKESPTDAELPIEEDVPSAFEMIEEMDAGFNLGNTFDLDLNSTRFDDIQPLIATYQLAGMNHVRVPVTWMDGFGGNTIADENGRVNFGHPRFVELKRVIDYALGRGMYVIINAHHERSFKEHYDGSASFNDRFTNLWTDIATHFADYGHRLVFEPLNEPEGAFGQWGGRVSPMDPNGIALTRQVMQVGVDAIRATGGRNTERLILLGLNGQGNHFQLDDIYPTVAELPGGGNDPYLAIEVHTYDPWDFCGQDGRNSAFPGTAEIERGLREVLAHARGLGVPLHYGEFGVGRRQNQSDRDTEMVRGFYRTIVQVAREAGMSSAAWDDRGWFGLISGSPQNGYTFVHDIVPSMLAE